MGSFAPKYNLNKMSAWGINNFENNVALDWLEELIQSNGSEVKAFMNSFVQHFNPEETTLDNCFKFLAICELFAIINHNPADDLPSELLDWMERTYVENQKEPLEVCAKGLKLILKDSEIKEMYLDSEYYESWKEIQENLLKRLKFQKNSTKN